MSLFWSACLGGGIGLLYVAMAYGTQHVAVRREGSGFMNVIVGGLLVRMVVLLLLVGTVLALVPIHVLAFVIALVVILLAGLGLDAWWMLRYLDAQKAKAQKPDQQTI